MCSCQVGSNGGDKSFDSIVWFGVIRLTRDYYIMLILFIIVSYYDTNVEC